MTRAISGRSRTMAFSVWPIPLRSWRNSPGRLLVLTLGATAIGVVGWSGDPWTLPLAMVFPAVWSLAGSRFSAALIASAYFLGASRGLPQGVSNFFGSDILLGLSLWVGASLAFVGVHAACWSRREGWRQARNYVLANVLMSVPPLGIVGWANPVTATGIIFPGWGWWGLGVTIVVLMVSTTRFRWPAIVIIGALALFSAVTWTDPASPARWRGIDTSFVSGRDQYADYGQQLSTMALVREAAADGAEVVVLPESAFGIWTPTIEALWRRGLADLDVTVVGGAVVLTETGYDNLMVSVAAGSSAVLYRQRMPVPVSMWQPWTSDGANADFFGNPVVTLDGLRLAVLLCYEQLLVWPVLHSMLFTPDVTVATANGWWTGSTNIVAIQRVAVTAWTRLFGVPVAMAFNHIQSDLRPKHE
ncbi:conjugal transfer protein TraB [Novosphingobium resinovorum]|uniref:conjugal transfer protein TraB n=1 Tax=Novosphingobium resinovorum TaxID=158500 RepID=UPI0030843B09